MDPDEDQAAEQRLTADARAVVVERAGAVITLLAGAALIAIAVDQLRPRRDPGQ